MKRLLNGILASSLVLSMTAVSFAQETETMEQVAVATLSTSPSTSGQTGPSTFYSYDKNTRTVTVRGTGEVSDNATFEDTYFNAWILMNFNLDNQADENIIEHFVIEEGITSLGKYSFANAGDKMVSVSLPESLLTIGDEAFASNKSLASIQLPSSLVSIGRSAFYLTGLKEVVIPDSVVSIGEKAFFVVNSLERIFVPSTVTMIGEKVFHYRASKQVETVYGTQYSYSEEPMEQITIYGYAGSAIEKYCQENGQKFVAVTSVPSWAQTTTTPPVTTVPNYPSWATTYIDYVSSKIMPDISDTNCDDASSRGLIAQSLYNLAGNGQTGISHNFTDGGAYSNAIAWCNANNIMNGTDLSTFNTNGSVKREEFALILQQLAKNQGKYVSASTMVLDNFSDVNTISSWAKDGMAWSVSNGLMSGSENKLNPSGNITRTEVAVMLYNFDKL